MSQEQKPESAEFRTREAQRQHIAQAWQCEGMSKSLADAWADREISEAEARGAAEQRKRAEIEAEAENARFADAAEENTLKALMRRHGIDREEASEELAWWQERDKRFPLNKAEQRRKDAEGAYGDWLPIETAPKDGTTILVPVKHIGADVVLWGAYGWRETSNMLLLRDQPAHWMPLPRFPSDRRSANVAALEARVKELEGALKEAAYALERVKDGERGGYNSRNGKFVSIQMSDGERADIIHSEVTEDCERALVTVRAAIREGGEHG